MAKPGIGETNYGKLTRSTRSVRRNRCRDCRCGGRAALAIQNWWCYSALSWWRHNCCGKVRPVAA